MTEGSQIVRAFMDRVNAGDLEGALDYVHADVDIAEPPTLPYGGRYRGHAEFRELMGKIGRTWASWRETPNRYVEEDGLVIRECHVRARLRSNGTVVEMPFVEVLEVADGRIVAMRPHYWDTGLLKQADHAGTEAPA